MKVTEQDINARIKAERYHYDGTLTLCVIELDNGFKATGESACVDPDEYDRKLGETMARSRAYSKLWAYFGFNLAEQMQRQARFAAEPKTREEAAAQQGSASSLNDTGATIPASLRVGANDGQGQHDVKVDAFTRSLLHPSDERYLPAA